MTETKMASTFVSLDEAKKEFLDVVSRLKPLHVSKFFQWLELRINSYKLNGYVLRGLPSSSPSSIDVPSSAPPSPPPAAPQAEAAAPLSSAAAAAAVSASSPAAAAIAAKSSFDANSRLSSPSPPTPLKITTTPPPLKTKTPPPPLKTPSTPPPPPPPPKTTIATPTRDVDSLVVEIMERQQQKAAQLHILQSSPTVVSVSATTKNRNLLDLLDHRKRRRFDEVSRRSISSPDLRSSSSSPSSSSLDGVAPSLDPPATLNNNNDNNNDGKKMDLESTRRSRDRDRIEAHAVNAASAATAAEVQQQQPPPLQQQPHQKPLVVPHGGVYHNIGHTQQQIQQLLRHQQQMLGSQSLLQTQLQYYQMHQLNHLYDPAVLSTPAALSTPVPLSTPTIVPPPFPAFLSSSVPITSSPLIRSLAPPSLLLAPPTPLLEAASPALKTRASPAPPSISPAVTSSSVTQAHDAPIFSASNNNNNNTTPLNSAQQNFAKMPQLKKEVDVGSEDSPGGSRSGESPSPAPGRRSGDCGSPAPRISGLAMTNGHASPADLDAAKDAAPSLLARMSSSPKQTTSVERRNCSSPFVERCESTSVAVKIENFQNDSIYETNASKSELENGASRKRTRHKGRHRKEDRRRREKRHKNRLRKSSSSQSSSTSDDASPDVGVSPVKRKFKMAPADVSRDVTAHAEDDARENNVDSLKLVSSWEGAVLPLENQGKIMNEDDADEFDEGELVITEDLPPSEDRFSEADDDDDDDDEVVDVDSVDDVDPRDRSLILKLNAAVDVGDAGALSRTLTTVDDRKCIVEYSLGHGEEAAEEKFGVHRKMIARWKKEVEVMNAVNPSLRTRYYKELTRRRKRLDASDDDADAEEDRVMAALQRHHRLDRRLEGSLEANHPHHLGPDEGLEVSLGGVDGFLGDFDLDSGSAKMYTPAQKKAIVEYAVQYGERAAAKKFGVHRKNIYRWKRNHNLMAKTSIKRPSGPRLSNASEVDAGPHQLVGVATVDAVSVAGGWVFPSPLSTDSYPPSQDALTIEVLKSHPVDDAPSRGHRLNFYANQESVDNSPPGVVVAKAEEESSRDPIDRRRSESTKEHRVGGGGGGGNSKRSSSSSSFVVSSPADTTRLLQLDFKSAPLQTASLCSSTLFTTPALIARPVMAPVPAAVATTFIAPPIVVPSMMASSVLVSSSSMAFKKEPEPEANRDSSGGDEAIWVCSEAAAEAETPLSTEAKETPLSPRKASISDEDFDTKQPPDEESAATKTTTSGSPDKENNKRSKGDAASPEHQQLQQTRGAENETRSRKRKRKGSGRNH